MPLPFLAGLAIGCGAVVAFNNKKEIIKVAKKSLKTSKDLAQDSLEKTKSLAKDSIEKGKNITKNLSDCAKKVFEDKEEKKPVKKTNTKKPRATTKKAVASKEEK